MWHLTDYIWKNFKIGVFFNYIGLNVELQVGLTFDFRIFLFFLNAAFTKKNGS